MATPNRDIVSASSASSLGALREGDRFHALDAFRSSMMLLGILLHINWFFQPTYFGHPLTDQAASWGQTYLFYWIHTFRMQAFFLVAGFFAGLLLHKRGLWGFVGNLSVRIGGTFVLFLVSLYPIMQLQDQLGGRISGRIQSDLSAWQSVVQEFRSLPISQLSVLHLWFLETLLLLYVISLVIWGLFHYGLDRRGLVRRWTQRAVSKIAGAPCGELLFALPVAAALFAANSWLGVNSGYALKPIWKGVFAYWVFFAVGWCIYRQPNLLGAVTRGWHLKLIAGTVLSVVLCEYYYSRSREEGMHFFYPLIGDTEIHDYAALRGQLLDEPRRRSDPLMAAIWENLSPDYRRFLEEKTRLTPDQLAGLGFELSIKVIANPTFHQSQALQGATTREPWHELLSAASHDPASEQASQARRHVLESALAPTILPRPTYPTWLRAGYFMAYAAISWLLTCGTLGLFLRLFSDHSRAWRYLADASYWMYLIHLPVLFQIQLWIAPIDLSWPLKYLMYFVPAMGVMLATYHFLVRPTPLGWLLNGRRYPLTFWRGTRESEPAPAAAVPAPHVRPQDALAPAASSDSAV